MFLAPALYAVHAVMTGLAMVVMDIAGVKLGFTFSAGLLDYLLNFTRATRPLLLLPIGAGCLLTNLPLSPLVGEEGMFSVLRHAGVDNELFPLLIFIGIGAMTDFGPLLENPKMVLLGAAGQFGIFLTLLLAVVVFGFTREQSASIGIIGAIDGPTSIYVSRKLAPELLAPITVAAYSYMSLVPIIMPPIMRALTTQKERSIVMPVPNGSVRMRSGGRIGTRRIER